MSETSTTTFYDQTTVIISTISMETEGCNPPLRYDISENDEIRMKSRSSQCLIVSDAITHSEHFDGSDRH